MGTILTDKETKTLLARISTKDRYKQVMRFLDDTEEFYPYSVKDIKFLVEKGLEEAAMGLGKTSEEMRKKHSL